MPVRLPPLTDPAPVVLLEGMVDYAGLYPPAALDMRPAVRNFAHYRASGSGWMLGDVSADLTAIATFNERHRVCFDECGAKVDVYEARAGSVADIERLSDAVPRDITLYLEVPVREDLDALIAAIARAGRRAKIRTGGVTADAFPTAAQVVRFLASCLAHDVPAKATAGLHHPLRGVYRLTYEADASTGRMFGFLNVLLAAALLGSGGSEEQAMALLEETQASAFEISEAQIVWHGPEGARMFGKHVLQQARERLVNSVGSCSFTEPVDESRALGWLP